MIGLRRYVGRSAAQLCGNGGPVTEKGRRRSNVYVALVARAAVNGLFALISAPLYQR